LKILPTEELISPLKTSNSGIITIIKKTSKTITSDSDPIFVPDQHYITLKFRSYNLNNLFKESSNRYKPITTIFSLSFFTWTSTDDLFYYNFVKNKDKGSAKRKVTFG